MGCDFPGRMTIPRVRESRLSLGWATINTDTEQVVAGGSELAMSIKGAGGLLVKGTDSSDSLSIDASGVVAVSNHHDLLGLGDDDHSIYLLASDATNRAFFASRWTDLTDGGGTDIHSHAHSDTTGRTTDDHHAQTHTIVSHDTTATGTELNTLTGGGATALHKHDHGALDGRGDDDHSIYILADGTRAFSGSILAADGSAADPSWSFANDPDTGFYSDSADAIGVSMGGTQFWEFSALGHLTARSSAKIRNGDGTVSFPSYSFDSYSDTGMYSAGANSIGFATDGIERIVIDNDGKVGIGTTSPDFTLDVVDSGTNSQSRLALTTYNNQLTYSSTIDFKKSHHDTKGTLIATLDTESLGSFTFFGVKSDNSNFTSSAWIRCFQDGAAGSSRVPTKLAFGTSPGGTTIPIERLTISPDGKVGIGEIAPDTLLHVKGTAYPAIMAESSDAQGGNLLLRSSTGGYQLYCDGDILKLWSDTNSTDVVTVSNTGLLTTDDHVRASTAIYRRYYHLGLASFDPGASGATWVAPNANGPGGWQLNADTEILQGVVDIHSDWDGASDPSIEIKFQINSASTENDTVDLKVVTYYMGTGESVTKTQTVEVATNVGDGGIKAQYTQFEAVIPLNWDEASNVIEAGDSIGFLFNLETDTSEVDDITINGISYFYNTTHVGIEDGDV